MDKKFITNEIESWEIMLNKVQKKNKDIIKLIYLELKINKKNNKKLSSCLMEYNDLVYKVEDSLERLIRNLNFNFHWEQQNESLKEIVLSGYIRGMITKIENDKFEFINIKELIAKHLNINTIIEMKYILNKLIIGEIYELKLKKYYEITLKAICLSIEQVSFENESHQIIGNTKIIFHVIHLFKDNLLLKIDKYELKGLNTIQLNQIEWIKKVNG